MESGILVGGSALLAERDCVCAGFLLQSSRGCGCTGATVLLFPLGSVCGVVVVGGRGGVGGGTRRGGWGEARRGGAGGGTGRGVGATVAVVRCGTGGGCGCTGWICCGGGWSCHQR